MALGVPLGLHLGGRQLATLTGTSLEVAPVALGVGVADVLLPRRGKDAPEIAHRDDDVDRRRGQSVEHALRGGRPETTDHLRRDDGRAVPGADGLREAGPARAVLAGPAVALLALLVVGEIGDGADVVVVLLATVVRGVEHTLRREGGGELLEHSLEVGRPGLAWSDVDDEPLCHPVTLSPVAPPVRYRHRQRVAAGGHPLLLRARRCDARSVRSIRCRSRARTRGDAGAGGWDPPRWRACSRSTSR